jgi:hypothetical protein
MKDVSDITPGNQNGENIASSNQIPHLSVLFPSNNTLADINHPNLNYMQYIPTGNNNLYENDNANNHDNDIYNDNEYTNEYQENNQDENNNEHERNNSNTVNNAVTQEDRDDSSTTTDGNSLRQHRAHRTNSLIM